jgi:hypothetical protein
MPWEWYQQAIVDVIFGDIISSLFLVRCGTYA